MPLTILVEPSQTGFRASTGGPLEMSADGLSANEAVNALNEKIQRRIDRGAKLIEQPITQPKPIIPLEENPLFDEWQREIENYQREKELEDQAIYG